MSEQQDRRAKELREYNLTELRWKLRDARDDLREIRQRLDVDELDGEDPEWWRECEREQLAKIAALELECRRRGLET
jgi:hypothetical protein